VEESFGAVYLEEGSNILSIVNAANVFGTDSIRDYDGETVSYVARANICLQGIEFKPLYQIGHERYTVYFPVEKKK